MLSSSHFCTSEGYSELGASHARSGTQACQHVRQSKVLAIPTPLRSLSFLTAVAFARVLAKHLTAIALAW